ncbi:TadE/TadG family type IV pilus assembly protein [Qipengyuania vesicularis]|uniref:TadE/TadG family type IV pilus assembly protein n=1 Tax=Qipengyuania vesicularis TaxID=2867232 RepID=UPI001C868B03|nr:TadE/TadG family type IV pilus assembly protein [Qipengyuania vesicularis]MBX7526843.1 pilus assembly protein [Qipengyuania vesicularis]
MISRMFNFARMRRDENGSVVVETAIVLPVLIMMMLGGFEASRIVSRENELQIAIAEAAAIVLAAIPEDQADLDAVELIIESSTGLPAGKVRLQKRYRCNADATLTLDITTCPTGAVISEFIHLNVWDSYTPLWTKFGIGKTVDYDIRRRIQIS